jgi:hypothetical protein
VENVRARSSTRTEPQCGRRNWPSRFSIIGASAKIHRLIVLWSTSKPRHGHEDWAGGSDQVLAVSTAVSMLLASGIWFVCIPRETVMLWLSLKGQLFVSLQGWIRSERTIRGRQRDDPDLAWFQMTPAEHIAVGADGFEMLTRPYEAFDTFRGHRQSTPWFDTRI